MHQNYAKINIGHCTHSRATVKTIIPLYLVHGLKSNPMFSECRCASSLDYVIFMHSTGTMSSAKLRNHLKAINQYLLYFKAFVIFLRVVGYHNFK